MVSEAQGDTEQERLQSAVCIPPDALDSGGSLTMKG